MIIEYNCEFCGKHVRKSQIKGMKHRFCSRKCKSEWQKTQKPVDKEWLYQKYIVEGLGCPEIAELVNRDSKRVWEWLQGYDIPTRPRGHNEDLWFAGVDDPKSFTGNKHSEETKEKIRQARLRDGHVPYLKNGKHHLKGKRGADTPNWKGGVTPERQDVYGTQEWKEAVKGVWKRDKAVCQRCGLHHKEARKNGIAFHIHHIISFAVKEFRCNVDNLILLCQDCHLWVHSNDNTEQEYINDYNR